ncbi:hypothetical protein D3C87_2016820 [compost metagenome]
MNANRKGGISHASGITGLPQAYDRDQEPFILIRRAEGYIRSEFYGQRAGFCRGYRFERSW